MGAITLFGNRPRACFVSRRVRDLLMVTGRLLAACVTVVLVAIARLRRARGEGRSCSVSQSRRDGPGE